jgi:predicted HicB family RNase H-like nuclease
VTFEGGSVRELKKAFHEAVDDYLETCAEVGKDPDKTYKGTFNVRISTDLHKAAAVYAAVNNISLNDFVKTAIDYALSHKADLNKKIAAASR